MVYDIMGKMIVKHTVDKNRIALNRSLRPGIYIAKLHGNTGDVLLKFTVTQ